MFVISDFLQQQLCFQGSERAIDKYLRIKTIYQDWMNEKGFKVGPTFTKWDPYLLKQCPCQDNYPDDHTFTYF